MNGKLVTVVIPVFNAGDFLRPAVISILNQSHGNLEVYVVDDGSTDGCMEGIVDIADSRLTVIRQENAGKAAAVNRVLDVMRGEYWTVQDADDISHPDRILRQVEALESEPDLAAVYICVELIVNERRFAPQFIGKSREECDLDVQRLQMPAHDAAGMYRVALVGDMRIDPELRIGEGFDLIMRIGEKHPIKVIDGCWYFHRLNLDSLTHRDPEWNIAQVNLAIRKACVRRGLDEMRHMIALPRKRRLFKHRDKDTIVTYALESVRQHKRIGRLGTGFQTAAFCARMHPLDPFYYKPMALFLTPSHLADCYRKMKKLMNASHNPLA